jgi:acetyl-CoA C-acetyltransferase
VDGAAMEETAPVIVGVGQFVERLDDPAYRGLSPVELAAEAGRAAIADAGGDGTLAARIAIVGAIRTFEDSVPSGAPFGKADKYPLAVASRLGISPQKAILEKAGGNTPLTLLLDVAERLRAGDGTAALIVGSEAISTVRHLIRAGEMRDWSESSDGEIENHGRGLEGMITQYNARHGAAKAPPGYALLEHARRARLGLTRAQYVAEMGRLFAPFTRVAAANPYASAAVNEMTADELIAVGERNRLIADPYPLKLVSRDQVNQGAAILVMTLGAARAAGIAEDRLIFIHGAALAQERGILARPDLGASLAAELTLVSALADAGKSVADMAHFDFYSCFPIAVFAAAIDALGLDPDDPRGLTVTGGLPYFGGPGNNYSMHAMAEMAQRLRARPGIFGLVGVNGGILTKYGAVVLSTSPAPWKGARQDALQAQIDAQPMPRIAHTAEGKGTVLTYTVIHKSGLPETGLVVGRLDSGERFLANAVDAETLKGLVDDDPIGRTLFATSTPQGNRFAWSAEHLSAVQPRRAPAWRRDYRHILVHRDGPVLEVTINRPERRNCLDFEANSELAEIFDAFEADGNLWVAILTGAGDQAFCAGADLKAAGGNRGIPKAGFGGLTSRRTRKPVIAAVNGIAFGGGLEAALACDLLVADPSASFGLTEVKVGMIAGAGGAIRLPRQIPRKVAVEMLLTGRHMNAAEAAEWGLVNRISEPGMVMETARELAAEIVACSPTSVRLTMQILHEGEETPSADLASRTLLNSTAIDALMVSEDMAEGLAAFAQKRKPRWMNR